MLRLAEHVFVVEDDDDARAAMAQSLAKSGYVVQAFSSIEALIERRHTEGPACVVLDYQLPGLFTPELRKKLLGDSGLSVVFVTSYADVPTVVKAMKSGAVDFLTKPVDAEQLAAAVSRGLERSERAQADWQSQRAFLERLGRLTLRERDVAMRMVRGLLSREIASELGTTEKTIKVHRGRVMAKLEVGSVAQLVRLLEDRGRGEALTSTTYAGSPGPVSNVAYPPRRGAVLPFERERSFETRRFHSSGSQPKWRSTC